MIVKERETVSIPDLIEYYIHWKGESVIDVEVISVVDEQGNVSKPNLDVVIETTYDDETDAADLTPDEQNDELRRLGF